MVCLARAAFAAGALLTCTAALADPSSDPTPTLAPTPFAQHGSPGAARHAKRLRIKRSPDFLEYVHPVAGSAPLPKALSPSRRQKLPKIPNPR